MCDITRSRGKQCKTFQGGTSKIFVYNYVGTAAFGAITAGEVTTLDAGITEAFGFELTGDGNTFEQPTTPDNTAGSKVTVQTLTFSLAGLTAADSADFNLLAASYNQCVMRDRNGNYRALAYDGDANWVVTEAGGGAKADFSGYNIVMTAETNAPAPFLDATAIASLLGIEVAPV